MWTSLYIGFVVATDTYLTLGTAWVNDDLHLHTTLMRGFFMLMHTSSLPLCPFYEFGILFYEMILYWEHKCVSMILFLLVSLFSFFCSCWTTWTHSSPALILPTVLTIVTLFNFYIAYTDVYMQDLIDNVQGLDGRKIWARTTLWTKEIIGKTGNKPTLPATCIGSCYVRAAEGPMLQQPKLQP